MGVGAGADALKALARRFGGVEVGPDLLQSRMTIAGRSIEIDVAPLVWKQDLSNFKPRLRFDKGVIRTGGRLRAALEDRVPDGATVVFTMTAPIRLAARTAAVLGARIADCLAREVDETAETINGNRILVRVMAGGPSAEKVVGFVHNPSTDPLALLDLSQALFQAIGAASRRFAPGEERWLALTLGGGSPPVDSLRQIYRQLSIHTDFAKLMLVSADGRIDALVDQDSQPYSDGTFR